ncbi:MAG: tRNA (N(6)-L-threonylcarbamoyladenosine(37)-C(2))-methylthiotransferase [Candidatus Micrarchaeota archaeon]
MASVYIETYGCTLNQADSDIIAAMLLDHDLVDSAEKADVIVFNTCTVKGATENKIFERMKRLSAAGKPFVIAGCLTANIPKIRKRFLRAPIVGTSSLRHIAQAVEDAFAGIATEYVGHESKDGLPKLLSAPICRVPLNEGCVSKCHFCHTKAARPFLRSYSPKTVVGWINDAVRKGAVEIQLTSQDAGAYGFDLKTSLIPLLNSINKDDSSGSSGKGFLVRLGMINPDHAKRMLPGIIEALSGPRFYRFIHVPVQSGSEKVCREMNRDHSVQDFRDIVSALREAIPDVCISTDVIVGYPTETEDDFQETLRMLQDTKPDTVNLSKFSPRPGTVAKSMKQLDNSKIKRRSEIASALIKGITLDCRKRYVGRRLRVLITEKEKDFKGRAINYHQVVVKGFKGNLGDSVDVEIYDANHGSLFGEPI